LDLRRAGPDEILCGRSIQVTSRRPRIRARSPRIHARSSASAAKPRAGSPPAAADEDLPARVRRGIRRRTHGPSR